MSYSFVGAAGIFLAYLVPVYTLAGFHSAENVAIEIGTPNIIRSLRALIRVASIWSWLGDFLAVEHIPLWKCAGIDSSGAELINLVHLADSVRILMCLLLTPGLSFFLSFSFFFFLEWSLSFSLSLSLSNFLSICICIFISHCQFQSIE